MSEAYFANLLAMPDWEFRQECIRRIHKARTARGRRVTEALAVEDLCARAAGQRPGGLEQWERAQETVNGTLLTAGGK